MKLLLINPNISDSVSELIRAEAVRSASPGTEIEVLTAPLGVAYIETRFEAMIGAYATAQLAAEHHARFDAVVVAAFGDPGLSALREVLPCPVTGLTEAALASACLLGQRFSIVAISQRIRAWYRETVSAYGLDGRLASIRGLDEPLADIGTVLDELENAIQLELKKDQQPAQFSLFSEDERTQLRRDTAALEARLARIPSERQQEAEAIETRYAKLNDRTFPVAVIFLVPASAVQGGAV